MKYVKLLFLISGIIGVLLWLTRRRDRDIEYPEQPEPPRDWWRMTESYPIDFDKVTAVS